MYRVLKTTKMDRLNRKKMKVKYSDIIKKYPLFNLPIGTQIKVSTVVVPDDKPNINTWFNKLMPNNI